MMTVHEVSLQSGVSIRTLHHYDAIGLLKPAAVTPAGYRLYDRAALQRLQTILLFRELRFPLKTIKAVLDDPAYDKKTALRDQIRLLERERERFDRLIELAKDQLKGGEHDMDFSAFDTADRDRYADEVKQRWGNTDAYRQSSEKTDTQTEAGGQALMAVFAELGTVRLSAPDSPAAQALIEKLRCTVSAHFYSCTPEILAGLGEMYVADDRFRQTIDAAGGDGTAAFVSRAITCYVKTCRTEE